MIQITEMSLYWFATGLSMFIPHFISSLFLSHRNRYVLRCMAGILVYVVLAYFQSLHSIFPIYIVTHNIVNYFYIIWCNRISLKGCTFFFIWGTSLYYLSEQLGAVFASVLGLYGDWTVMFYCKVVSVALVSAFQILITPKLLKKDVLSFSWKQVLLSVLISVSVIMINIISFRSTEQRDLFIFMFQLFSMMIVVLALYLQVVITYGNQQQNEAEFLKLLFRMNKKDYEAKREYVELVNHKYHDLKHEIRALRQMNPEERNEHLDRLEKSLDEYKNLFQTGNEALDTILNDKRRECENRGIVFTCTAQGGDLEFIDLLDLNILLGNMIDNAIEAVLPLPKEKQVIDMKIFIDRQFLRIYEANYYEGELQYAQDGLVSTKPQDGYHGFGTRSMKYIVDRYHGEMTVDAKDQMFRLHILIPIPE